MAEFLTELTNHPFLLSYAGLFMLAFLSASLLPMGSAWLLLLLLSQGESPLWLWVVASVGNTLCGVLNYWHCYYNLDFVLSRLYGDICHPAVRRIVQYV